MRPQIKKRALAAAVVLVSVHAVAADGGNHTATLLCEATINGERATSIVHLDYSAQTVDGYQAVFSPSRIAWESLATDSDGKYTLVEQNALDRQTGKYIRWRDRPKTATDTPPYACKVVSDPMF